MWLIAYCWAKKLFANDFISISHHLRCRSTVFNWNVAAMFHPINFNYQKWHTKHSPCIRYPVRVLSAHRKLFVSVFIDAEHAVSFDPLRESCWFPHSPILNHQLSFVPAKFVGAVYSFTTQRSRVPPVFCCSHDSICFDAKEFQCKRREMEKLNRLRLTTTSN